MDTFGHLLFDRHCIKCLAYIISKVHLEVKDYSYFMEEKNEGQTD
jgi:hypothetical protein